MFIASRRLISEVPSVVAALAVDYGLTMEQVFGVFMAATSGLVWPALEMLKETAIPQDLLEDENLALWPWPQEPVWERIAELLGTTFDRDACQIYHLNAVAAAQAEANP